MATTRVVKPARLPLYTIGHSTRTYDELVAVLKAWGVTTLVDIRQFTRSFANPQFNEKPLRRRLVRDGITYVAMPELGGRRRTSKTAEPTQRGVAVAAFKNYADYAETTPFLDALTVLLAMATTTACAVMCAEAVWWRCHRRIVADYAITRGMRVMHIFTATKAERAIRTRFARLDRRTKTLRYPRAPQ